MALGFLAREQIVQFRELLSEGADGRPGWPPTWAAPEHSCSCNRPEGRESAGLLGECGACPWELRGPRSAPAPAFCAVGNAEEVAVTAHLDQTDCNRG